MSCQTPQPVKWLQRPFDLSGRGASNGMQE